MDNEFERRECGKSISEKVKSHLPTATIAVAILGLIAGISQQTRETTNPIHSETEKSLAQQKDAGADPFGFLNPDAASVSPYPQYKAKVEALLRGSIALLPYHNTMHGGCKKLSEIPLRLKGVRWNMRVEGIKYEMNPFAVVDVDCYPERHRITTNLKFILKKQSGLKDEMIISYTDDYIGITIQQFDPKTNKALSNPMDVSHIWASNCPNFQQQTPCTNEKDLPFMRSMTDLIDKALQTAESVARRLAEEERARKKTEEARLKRSILNP